MLAQNYRDVLVVTATEVLLGPVSAQNFFNAIRPGIWAGRRCVLNYFCTG